MTEKTKEQVRELIGDFLINYSTEMRVDVCYPMSCDHFASVRKTTTVEFTEDALERFLHEKGLMPFETDRWYKTPSGSIVFVQSLDMELVNGVYMCTGYGVNSKTGEWCNNSRWYLNPCQLVKAKPFEVETALCNEAEKRGLKKGTYIKSPRGSMRFICDSMLEFTEALNQLATAAENTADALKDGIFLMGKWAQVMERPRMKRDTWYEVSDGHLIYATTDEENGSVYGYGFDSNGKFENEYNYGGFGRRKWTLQEGDTYHEARNSVILEALRGECVKRGLVYGSHAMCASNGSGIETINGCDYHVTGSNKSLRLWVESLRAGEENEIMLFKHGKFARVM